MEENLFEMAERLERAQREYLIQQASARTLPESHPHFDGAHCVECDMPIPRARLDLGKIRCVPCQTTKERYGA